MPEDIFAKLDKLKELDDRKKELKKEEKEINEELAPLMKLIFDHFLNKELEGIKYRGKNFFPKVVMYPAVKNKEKLKAILMEKGLNNLITTNAQALASHIREEIQANDGEMPKEYDGILETYDRESIGIRKA